MRSSVARMAEPGRLLESFLPRDRCAALATGTTVPQRSPGSALFADISGFTALSETMAATYGARRGAEELTRVLNTVYEQLIDAVTAWGGVVMYLSGDAITCWFDGDDGAAAVQAALDQQAVMAVLARELPLPGGATLALKVAVAVGRGPAVRGRRPGRGAHRRPRRPPRRPARRCGGDGRAWRGHRRRHRRRVARRPVGGRRSGGSTTPRAAASALVERLAVAPAAGGRSSPTARCPSRWCASGSRPTCSTGSSAAAICSSPSCARRTRSSCGSAASTSSTATSRGCSTSSSARPRPRWPASAASCSASPSATRGPT